MKKMGEKQRTGQSNSTLFQTRKEAIYAMGQLKIEDSLNDNGGAVDEVGYPDRPGEPDCLHYLRTGSCGYGSRCRFNHPPFPGQVVLYASDLPERDGQPECKFYLKTGTCKFGSTCRFHHPQDRLRETLTLNILGLPIRKEEKQCSYYMRNGTCKYGIMCKFDHPQPASDGNGLAAAAPIAYGSVAFLPSSGVPYAGAVSEFSRVRTTYVPNPSLHVPQNYMPVLLPPQGWSTYTGIMSQQSPTTSALANSTSNRQMHSFSTSAFQLPDRPDQPECRDFMNTGICKYALDCKYHHPRDMAAPILSNSLGISGLPSRPGQATCSYYTQYGFCKDGPTCRFDHPLPGYLYNYYLAMPYQWSSPTGFTAESAAPSQSFKHPDLLKKAKITKGQSSRSGSFDDVHLNTVANSSKRSVETLQDASD